MFDQEAADAIFDDFMTNRVAQGALFSDFVTLLNMKAAANTEDEAKMALLTEILNDVKLFIQPLQNDLAH